MAEGEINKVLAEVSRRLGLRKAFCLMVLAVAAMAEEPTFDIQLTSAELAAVGQRIFQNECNAEVSCLVHWNQGEAFPSLGIGHFIWYPAGVDQPFVESFPVLVEFMKLSGIEVPKWLEELDPFNAPWPDRAAFLTSRQSDQVESLRQLLFRTQGVQAEFILARAQASLLRVADAAPKGEQQEIKQKLSALSSTPGGVYALIDYVNFKGEGLTPSESYQGQGWGLLQVLQAMSQSDPGTTLAQFRQAAAAVLTRRAENASKPHEREKWLPGWLNRVRTYQEPGEPE